MEGVFLEREPNALLDLTCLLLTGRASDALSDFLGSGEQMSERVIYPSQPYFGFHDILFVRGSISGRIPLPNHC
jgi:hypothetical protein